jgi:hypothetical protein
MLRDATSFVGNSIFAYRYEVDDCMANHSVPVSPALATLSLFRHDKV